MYPAPSVPLFFRSVYTGGDRYANVHMMEYSRRRPMSASGGDSSSFFPWSDHKTAISGSAISWPETAWAGVRGARGQLDRVLVRMALEVGQLGLFKKHQLWKLKAGGVVSHGFRHAEFNGA